MKKLFFLIVALFSLGFLACIARVQPSGDDKTIEVPVQAFSKIVASNALQIEVTVVPGAACAATLTGSEEQVNNIKAVVVDRTLQVSAKRDRSFTSEHVVIMRLTVPSLESVDLSGANNLFIKGNLTGPAFNAELSGACNVKIEQLNVSALHASISGAGKISVENGQVVNATYDLSGASAIRTYGLQCKNVTLDMSGAGSAEVFASDHLKADLSGTAVVRYKGNASVDQDVSGIANIKHVD
ncbi:MAG: DUF2807 domain-containing protein [Chitinophagia bacterium]|nr:DUF2807 domain-containing protein [Chitinophagia bacterium]